MICSYLLKASADATADRAVTPASIPASPGYLGEMTGRRKERGTRHPGRGEKALTRAPALRAAGESARSKGKCGAVPECQLAIGITRGTAIDQRWDKTSNPS